MDQLIERAAKDLLHSKYAIALTGAGISTESGIPDFRGPSGIWTTDKEAEAKAYERYELFLRDPRGYWQEVLGGKDRYRGFYDRFRESRPNPGHYALAELEDCVQVSLSHTSILSKNRILGVPANIAPICFIVPVSLRQAM